MHTTADRTPCNAVLTAEQLTQIVEEFAEIRSAPIDRKLPLFVSIRDDEAMRFIVIWR